MDELMLRRRGMMGAAGEPKEPGLLQQGSFTFNNRTITISGTTVAAPRWGTSYTDAYNKFRCYNLTKFSANVTEGQNKTADIEGQPTIKTIPAGSTCVFQLHVNSSYYQASYTYALVELIDPNGDTIQGISDGKNKPKDGSVSWTAAEDTDIACIALKLYHFSHNAYVNYTLSLTVNGEEWLP